MLEFNTEEQLTRRIVAFWRTAGYRVATEVAFHNSRVDVVAVRRGRIVAIEVKLHLYKKAILQARNHCLFANEVYVALPMSVASSLDWDLSATGGIGLIGANETDLKVLVKSNSKLEPNPSHSARIMRYINLLEPYAE